MRRRPLVAGNWKMNGTLAGARALAGAVARGVDDLTGLDAVACPPFVHLPVVAEAARGTRLAVGAQNVSEEAAGAYTGEVAVAMLEELGCRYVIVGHSERRTLYGETPEMVARKCARVLTGPLIPIVCVGESLAEREGGETETVVDRQLDAVLDAVGVEGIARGVVAYEPIWAIGTGRTASPTQAAEVHGRIRARIGERSEEVAASVRIVYGGSVKPDNAAALFAETDIDGALVGGASLNAEEFLKICREAVDG